ncbi:hypothetical protein ACLKA7_010636 [Drosophila subpalustris]
MISSTIKGVVAILNCILARQLCFEDPSCSAILEIIPRVCGPIPGQIQTNEFEFVLLRKLCFSGAALGERLLHVFYGFGAI